MLTTLSVLLLPTIWIVDANSGPGSNFTDLPAAVAAAQSGDTILVQAGSYTAFYVAGKSLTIRGAGSGATTIDRLRTPTAGLPYETVTIDGTAPGLPFYIGGVRIAPVAPTGASTLVPPALLVLPGANVTLADCVVTGAQQSPLIAETGAAAEVRGELHAMRTNFVATNAVLATGSFATGGPGVRVATTGRFAATASRCEGGDATGGSLVFVGGGASGSGLLVEGGQAMIAHTSCFAGSVFITSRIPGQANIGSGVEVSGGRARIAGDATDACNTSTGTGIVSPGAGIRVNSGSAFLHGNVTLTGLFGSGIPTMGTVTTGPVLPSLTITGTNYPNGETNATLPATLTLHAPTPSVGYVLLVDVQPAFADVAGLPVVGEALVPLVGNYQEFGVLDAAGNHAFTFTPSVVLGSALGIPIYFQGAMLEPAQARVSWGEVRIFR